MNGFRVRVNWSEQHFPNLSELGSLDSHGRFIAAKGVADLTDEYQREGISLAEATIRARREMRAIEKRYFDYGETWYLLVLTVTLEFEGAMLSQVVVTGIASDTPEEEKRAIAERAKTQAGESAFALILRLCQQAMPTVDRIETVEVVE